MLNVSIFRLLNSLNQETSSKFNDLLFYNLYYEWMKRLEEEIDFVQVLTTYCFRQTMNNVINNKSR